MNEKKTEAFISLMTDGDGRCEIRFKGDAIQLADMLFTAMYKSDQLAALFCQTAKDFIDSIKGDPAKWKELACDCAYVQQRLVSRYGSPTVKEK